MPLRRYTKSLLAGLIVFVTTFLVFLFSPVHTIADSSYSMLLSQGLLQNHSFALDKYAVPHLPPTPHVGFVSDGNIYQLEFVDGHLYYLFPPGTSVLSAPYVGVMHLFGVGVANPDRTYSAFGEQRMEIGLAALLMAGFVVVVFLTARMVLPVGWSLVVALGTALGTQVWSGASRAMWSDTWGVFLLGVTLLLLVGVETRRWRLRPLLLVLLATILCWMYFVRPTYSIAIAAVCVYVFLYHHRRRAHLILFALTGLLWLAGFVAYSEHYYHQLMPNYYKPSRLRFADFGQALAGNLISPSRGLLVFVPVLCFVGYLLIRYRGQIALPKLACSAGVVIPLHLVAVSGFSPWHGGWCYGPRYSTGLVPWFALLTILAVDAKRRASMAAHRAAHPDKKRGVRTRAEWAVGALLLGASMAINGTGAISPRTADWNVHPVNVDDAPGRVWDWHDPQFLRAAGNNQGRD